MARQGSGLRTAIRVVKAIDRVNKQAAREVQCQEKARLRAEAQVFRENERAMREAQRELKRKIRQQQSTAKQEFKDAMLNANEAYLERCEERAILRKQFIQEVLK